MDKIKLPRCLLGAGTYDLNTSRYGTSIYNKTFEIMLKKLPFARNPLALSSNRYFSLSLEPLQQSLLRY